MFSPCQWEVYWKWSAAFLTERLRKGVGHNSPTITQENRSLCLSLKKQNSHISLPQQPLAKNSKPN